MKGQTPVTVRRLALIVFAFLSFYLGAAAIGTSQALRAFQGLELEPIESVTIPASGAAVTTQTVLNGNLRYTLIVEGTYRYDTGEPGELADAQYREDDDNQFSIRWNSVEINGVAPAADTHDLLNHRYSYFIAGNNQPIQLRIFDEHDSYGDNAGELKATLYPFREGTDRDPYADAVTDYDARGGGNTHRDAAWVLGAPSCGTYDLSLGGGFVVVDMGEGEEIADGEGPDFRVYESSPPCGGGSASQYGVSVAAAPDGPWVYVANGEGVSNFDLSGTGLSAARYIRVDDLSDPSPAQTPGADIDAFEAIHMVDPPYRFTLQLPFDEPVASHKDKITAFLDHNFPVTGIAPPQAPDYDVITFSGERAIKSAGTCANRFGVQIYKTTDGRCIAYDGHNAYDFGLNTGRSIRPAAPGILYNICNNPVTCGSPPWFLFIRHSLPNGDEYVTIYGHIQPDPEVLAAWQAAPNRELPVDTTQAIGTITAQAGHLHFMVRHNGKDVDPYGWLGTGQDPLEKYNQEPPRCLWVFGCHTQVTIGAGGGAMRSTEGDVFVTIPTAAHAEALNYLIVGLPAYSEVDQPEGLASGGHAFRLTATTAAGNPVNSLAAPVKLEIWFEDRDVAGLEPGTVALYHWNSNAKEWQPMPTTRAANNGPFAAYTTDLGLFALLGQPVNRIHLPILMDTP